MNHQKYIGRFAPSPTGPLHYGSLVTAVASYLQAKHNQGEWLLRIEDIDPPREIKGAVEDILATLECYQFEWDQKVLYQSTRFQDYRTKLERLSEQNLIYACSCTRKELEKNSKIGLLGALYPGTCKNKNLDINNKNFNLRIRTTDESIRFKDKHYGELNYNLNKEIGDFIIYRKFDLPSYALAATVDDIHQGITEIVRGQDLLAFTPLQIYLYKIFEATAPNFLHVPIIVNPQGQKLSKQTKAKAIPKQDCGKVLIQALNSLGQNIPSYFKNETVTKIWNWAIEHWDASKIPNKKQIPYYE